MSFMTLRSYNGHDPNVLEESIIEWYVRRRGSRARIFIRGSLSASLASESSSNSAKLLPPIMHARDLHVRLRMIYTDWFVKKMVLNCMHILISNGIKRYCIPYFLDMVFYIKNTMQIWIWKRNTMLVIYGSKALFKRRMLVPNTILYLSK